MNTNYLKVLVLFSFFLLFFTKNAYALEHIPIDGGLSYLILAGIGYGVFRLTKKKDQTE